uniref:Uncharacterized protein n=1 Tax=Lactuca sativa TaxID=4236 RepID=A0A9R1WFD0_LACSA|nr:hypothetical protein LSAT_V11C100012680 [Lactuca sativa]
MHVNPKIPEMHTLIARYAILEKVYVLKTIISDFTFKDVWYHVTCSTCAVLTDNTDKTTIFMSDKTARSLVNVTAQEIMDLFPNQDGKTLPDPLQRCKGLTKNVFVQCTKLPSTKNIRPQPKITSPRKTPHTPSTTMDQQTTTTTESFTRTKSCEIGKRLQLEHTCMNNI